MRLTRVKVSRFVRNWVQLSGTCPLARSLLLCNVHSGCTFVPMNGAVSQNQLLGRNQRHMSRISSGSLDSIAGLGI